MTDSAPSGIITLVFTDIQGSTDLWESIGESFHETLELHNSIFRAAIADHEGYEVKTEGDAFMIAFEDPSKALACCLDIQERLQSADWDEAVLQTPQAGATVDEWFRGVRVRMGIHRGEAICQRDSATDRMDYFGPMVNRAARIGGAAHGGQIVISADLWESLVATLGETCTHQSLGEHRLKGLERPEGLTQILPKSLSGRDFPPLRTLSPKLTNLPRRLTSFVGREKELRELGDWLSESSTHLATLLGPGGTGKTRLSLRLGGILLSDFPGGVWFADGSEATTLSGVCHSLAQALAIPLTSAEPLAQIGHALDFRSRESGRTLVIFDNAEQVIDACAKAIGDLLQAAPEVCFLVTSRELLNIEGEREFRLDPLPLPGPGECPMQAITLDRHTAKLEAFASVKLFMDRARAANSRLEFDQENLAAAAEICRLLEGIPLAIELAASRTKLLKPSKLLAKLKKDGNAALKGKRRDVSGRQATLDGAIAWSWDLLNDAEGGAMCALALFRGGFFLEQAEALLGDEAEELVAGLLDKSLLKQWEVQSLGETRYGMYRSIQEFAESKSDQIVDFPALRLRWARTLVAYCEEWQKSENSQKKAKEALDRLELEVDALFSSAWEDPKLKKLFAALLLSVNGVALARGSIPVIVELYTMALRSPFPLEPALHVALLRGFAAWTRRSGDRQRAEVIREEALERAQRWFDATASFEAELEIASIADHIASVHGHGFSEASEEVFRKYSHDQGLARIAHNKGVLAMVEHDLEAAEKHFRTAMEVMSRAEDFELHTDSRGMLATVELLQGRVTEGLEQFRELEEFYAEIGNLSELAWIKSMIGAAYRETHKYREALPYWNEAIRLFRLVGREARARREEWGAARLYVLLAEQSGVESDLREAQVALSKFPALETTEGKQKGKRDRWLVGAMAMARHLEGELQKAPKARRASRILALEAKRLMIEAAEPRHVQNLKLRAGELQHNWRWIDRVLAATDDMAEELPDQMPIPQELIEPRGKETGADSIVG